MNDQKQTVMRKLSAGQVISLLAGMGSDLTANGEYIGVSMSSNGICFHLDEGTVEINFIRKGGAA